MPDPTLGAVEAMARAAEPKLWSEAVEKFIQQAEADEPMDGRSMRAINNGQRKEACERAEIYRAAYHTHLAATGWAVVPVEADQNQRAAMGRLNHPRDHEIYAAGGKRSPPLPRSEARVIPTAARMQGMDEVIERLKAAEVGSRELDALVAVEAGWTEKVLHEGVAVRVSVWTSSDGWKEAELPAWTTSVDAALTLVPDGWWLTLKMLGKYFHVEGEFDCDTADRDLTDDEEMFAGNLATNARTLPLAICIAALTAKDPTYG